MLRQAIRLATERGIDVCGQLHDAILIEADADVIDDIVVSAQAAMAQASAILLDGIEIATEAEVVVWPVAGSIPAEQRPPDVGAGNKVPADLDLIDLIDLADLIDLMDSID